MFEWLIPILVFISVLIAAIELQKIISQMHLKHQAMTIAAKGTLKFSEEKKKKVIHYLFKLIELLGSWQQSIISPSWSAKIAQKYSFHQQWQTRSPEQWLAAKELAAGAGCLFAWWLTHDWLWIIIVSASSFYLPDLWLKERRLNYQQSIMKALPNNLDLLAAGIQAGLNFEQALNVILERNHDGVIYSEFKEMIRSIQVGRSRQDAFKVMADKVNEPDFSAFISALIQSEKMGVSLAETLKNQATHLRIKYSQRIEKRALEAPVKMLFPLILFIFPIIFIILFGPIILRFVQGF